MENLVTSKEVSEKLNKLGVEQNTQFWWCESYGFRGGYKVYSQKLNNKNESFAAYTISELKEPLKPYMKDIEISARDDIFNPDFWGNYLISRLTK